MVVSGPLALPGRVPLALPGRVTVSENGQRLAIADTGHDQVLVCLLDGLLLEAHTGLSQPQGVCFHGDDVVVCDAGADRVVSTTGEVLADGLISPRDVTSERLGWLVAEAGRHRIVRIKAWEHQARPVAGSGTPGLVDGPWYKAQLDEPSGLAPVDGGLAFVDAGSGALRLLDDAGRVVTLLDQSGGLEGPLAVAAAGDRLYVADTLNSLLKVWQGGSLSTLPVAGLNEPGGLAAMPDGRLAVADTGNHRVVIADPSSGELAPVVIDESWLTSPDGAPLEARSGQVTPVPYAVHLAGEELDPSDGPPVQVRVEARPASLLAAGPTLWATGDVRGTVGVRVGASGSGLLLAEATARTRHGDRREVRLFRRRHHLTVSV